MLSPHENLSWNDNSGGKVKEFVLFDISTLTEMNLSKEENFSVIFLQTFLMPPSYWFRFGFSFFMGIYSESFLKEWIHCFSCEHCFRWLILRMFTTIITLRSSLSKGAKFRSSPAVTSQHVELLKNLNKKPRFYSFVMVCFSNHLKKITPNINTGKEIILLP